ncbi:MAG: hypothetical protein R2880_15065 [Deinococcales bacterium]
MGLQKNVKLLVIKVSSIKRTAEIFIILGIIGQLFIEMSIYFLPSMASADGVAIYPPLSSVLISIFYFIFPYLLFELLLIVASQRSSHSLRVLSLASIFAVLSPIFIIQTLQLFTSEWDTRFWEIRPIFQLVVFLLAALIFNQRVKADPYDESLKSR